MHGVTTCSVDAHQSDAAACASQGTASGRTRSGAPGGKGKRGTYVHAVQTKGLELDDLGMSDDDDAEFDGGVCAASA